MKTIINSVIFSLLFIVLSCRNSNDNNPAITCTELTDTSGTFDKGRIFMATAFSPNKDGLNDTIRPITFNIAQISFTIYDDNNTILFTTNQLKKGWCPEVTTNTFIKYHYKILSTTVNNHIINKCGDLYLATCLPQNNSIELFFEDQFLSGSVGSSELLPICP